MVGTKDAVDAFCVWQNMYVGAVINWVYWMQLYAMEYGSKWTVVSLVYEVLNKYYMLGTGGWAGGAVQTPFLDPALTYILHCHSKTTNKIDYKHPCRKTMKEIELITYIVHILNLNDPVTHYCSFSVLFHNIQFHSIYYSPHTYISPYTECISCIFLPTSPLA